MQSRMLAAIEQQTQTKARGVGPTEAPKAIATKDLTGVSEVPMRPMAETAEPERPDLHKSMPPAGEARRRLHSSQFECISLAAFPRLIGPCRSPASSYKPLFFS
jgi:hypothetical protein